MSDLWNEFEKTGNVEDYLKFRGVLQQDITENQAAMEEKTAGSIDHGTEYHSDRDGVNSHACG